MNFVLLGRGGGGSPLTTANADPLAVAVASSVTPAIGQTVSSAGSMVDAPGTKKVAGGALLAVVRAVSGVILLQCGQGRLLWKHQWFHQM